MKQDLPLDYNQSIYELEPRGIMQFFELVLRDGTRIPLSAHPEFTYQGKTYSQIACTISPTAQDANGRTSRPKFSFTNPEGLFTHAIGQGTLEEAMLYHREALVEDVIADRDFFRERSNVISRVLTVSKTMVVTELRDVMDRHNFVVPSRAYYPPEFPHVKLS